MVSVAIYSRFQLGPQRVRYDYALFTIDLIDLRSVIKGAESASYNILSLFFLPFQNISVSTSLCHPCGLEARAVITLTPVSVIVSSLWTQ